MLVVSFLTEVVTGVGPTQRGKRLLNRLHVLRLDGNRLVIDLWRA